MSELVPEAAAGALTKKIGPLPGIAWVLVIAGAAYGVYWWKKRGTASTAPATAAAGADPSATGFSSAGPAEGTGTYSGQVNTVPVGQAAVSTNAAWALTVGNALIATGKYDASVVQNALSKYLTGGTLTAQEQAIINTAVSQFQLPPEGVMPVHVTAPAPAAPHPAAPKPVIHAPAKAPARAKAPAAPSYHWYTVKPGDSLSAIAGRTWGVQDWQRLYADNRSAIGHNPDLIHAGLKLKVANHR